jgi:hypothetical protein
MSAYQKAVSLGYTTAIVPNSNPPRGYTDAEVVSLLQALPRHRRNVYITGGPANTESVNLLHLLTARHRVMMMGSAQQWIGPLVDLEPDNPQVALIMSILRPMLQVNDTMVYCADSDEAAGMLNALSDVVSALTQKPTQVKAEVALLSGGRISEDYATLTPEQLASQRAEAEAAALAAAQAEAEAQAAQALQTLRDGLQQRFDAIKNQIGTSEQTLAVTALQEMADELEIV